jgi:hypothetical protein
MIYQVKPKGNFLAAFGASAIIELAEDSGIIVDQHAGEQSATFTDEHGDTEFVFFNHGEALVVDTDTGAWTLTTLEEFDEVFYIVA